MTHSPHVGGRESLETGMPAQVQDVEGLFHDKSVNAPSHHVGVASHDPIPIPLGYRGHLSSTEKKPRQVHQVSEAMVEIFNYIENHNDSQFTLKDPRDVLAGNSEEERLRIVEAAAAIIHEDIRSSVIETKSYPPPSKMLIKENQEIPKSLLHFYEEVIMKNRKGKIANSKTKCRSIRHAIMAALRERSFSSQLLLSISVFLHRRYRSERLIDVLYRLGFAASYAHAVDVRNRGVQCSSAQYNGQACFNASRYESDFDEDCTFDPEILQDLETNILDDENNGNE
ncbi:uncharacterized protein TNCV_3478781 [Trichonephila clavipes]|nr:uncharacterized protein TNCV_3478781 [Trichonephila clavipes]